MNQEIKAPEFEVLSFIPQNFFNKEVNEEFIKLTMKSVLPIGEWVKGVAEKNEPDYIYNKVPFEFTLASDKCKKNNKDNFINKLRTITYTSNNTEDDAINYIKNQIEVKANKKYSLENVHLCILSLIEKFDWVSDEYGSYTHDLIDYKRESFFNEIKKNYIDTNIFKNIFIIFPDMTSFWWVWDVASDKKISLRVTPQMMESEKYPYFIEKRLYTQFVEKGLLKDLFGIGKSK